MEATQENSASFERLKNLLNDSLPDHGPDKEKSENTQNKRKRIALEDTQVLQDASDEEESGDAIGQGFLRAANPTDSLLLAAHAATQHATQSSPLQKPQLSHAGDSQLPNTLLTDTYTGVDRTHTIHLSYSPEKLTHPHNDMDETQADPDSYNDRMRDNVTSMTEGPETLLTEENLDSERMFDSPSQRPIYFDERKRFSNVGLLMTKTADGSDNEDELVVPMAHLQDEALPLGLTQMFEASSPQRPVTNSSMIPSSPRLGFSSPAVPKAAPANFGKSPGIQAPVNHYVSVEESQEERERRKRISLFPEESQDTDFAAAPPDLLARLRGQRREKDSVEQFKEISAVRPPQPTKVKGRRGRPPKNRHAESLLPPSVPEIDEPSSPLPHNLLSAGDEPVPVEEESAGEDADEMDGGEPELEVPGTMEAAVTEVKKTQSSQHFSSVAKDISLETRVPSSQVDVIADSQPNTTAKTKKETAAQYEAEVMKMAKDIVGTSSSIPDPRQTRRRNPNIIESSSPGKSSALEDIPSSSPPINRIAQAEQLGVASSPPPEPIVANENAAFIDTNETPRVSRTRRTAAYKVPLQADQIKTPFTAQKIVTRIPNTIPATSPYNRTHLLSEDTPVPLNRRKRKIPEEIPSSIDLVPTGDDSSADKEASELDNAGQSMVQVKETPNPRSKRIRSDNLPPESKTPLPTEKRTTKSSTRARRQDSPDESADTTRNTKSISPVDMDITPTPSERPALTVDTTTPQKATLPFKPTESEKKVMNAPSPLRVFAQWEQSYFPATVPGISKYQDTIPARFVGGESLVRPDRMKPLELRPGDSVKIHGQGAKVWIVREAYKSMASSAASRPKTESQTEREDVLDIHGNDMVRLKHKTSEKTLDAHIGEVILTANQFYQLKSETLLSQSMNTSTEESPSLRRDDSLLDTPSKFSRRSTPSVVSDSMKLKPFKLNQSIKGKQGTLSGMRFTISLPGQEDQDRYKSSLQNLILKHGGGLLETGFEDLFEAVDEEAPGLTPRSGFDDIGFTAVISDRHSTTVKYCQALALGLPCLSLKWVEDSAEDGIALEWEDYLLPAGESQYLNGTVKSRVIEWVDTRSATLATMFSKRRKLLDGMNVIFHEGGWKKKSEYQPYTFLLHAMAPARIHHVRSVDAVNDLLKAKNSKIKWHYVFSKDGGANFSARRKGRDAAPVKFVSDEWLKQSLILGRLLGEDI